MRAFLFTSVTGLIFSVKADRGVRYRPQADLEREKTAGRTERQPGFQTRRLANRQREPETKKALLLRTGISGSGMTDNPAGECFMDAYA
jgi:hypothetical protein